MALEQIQRKLHIIVISLFPAPVVNIVFSRAHTSLCPARMAEKDDRYYAGTAGGAGDVRASTCDRNFIAFQTAT